MVLVKGLQVGVEVLGFGWGELLEKMIRDVLAGFPSESLDPGQPCVEVGQSAPDVPVDILISDDELWGVPLLIVVLSITIEINNKCQINITCVLFLPHDFIESLEFDVDFLGHVR